ncbi:MAG TPA: hypothetical protein VKQ30_21825 [Ktedonobacterales bacterium]|nr:hypothetical protein [Ktedonobacterales bacterium]
MLSASIGEKSTKVILALLLCGSVFGFVLGQELHHPYTPIAHHASFVTASAPGSLGIASTTAPHVTKIVSRTTPHGTLPTTRPAQKHHHGKDSNTITVSANALGSIQVYVGSENSNTHGGDNAGGND